MSQSSEAGSGSVASSVPEGGEAVLTPLSDLDTDASLRIRLRRNLTVKQIEPDILSEYLGRRVSKVDGRSVACRRDVREAMKGKASATLSFE